MLSCEYMVVLAFLHVVIALCVCVCVLVVKP